VGYGILVDAGYDPRGFVGMFAKLQQASGLNDSGAFPYLRSHPLTTERMADMQARQQLNTPTAPASNMAQAMLAARARVLSQTNPDALRAWTQSVPSAANRALDAPAAGALYAATLAHLQLRNMAEAERTLAALSQRVDHAEPGVHPAMAAQRWLRLLRAEVAFKQNRFNEVLDMLNPGPVPVSLQRPELLAVAQSLTRLPQHPWQADMVRQLRAWVQQAPHDGQAWNILASLLALQGQALASLRAEGEAQIARLDWGGAIDRLRAAQDLAKKGPLKAGEHIEASIVDARLRHAQERWREQQLQR
jgi:predicted Zn-dependent protease